MPWSGHFIPANTIKSWLSLLDFELIRQDGLLFGWPGKHFAIYNTMLEWLGKKCCKPLGGCYIVIAKAKMIPLTPIRLRWQQNLTGLHASLPGSAHLISSTEKKV